MAKSFTEPRPLDIPADQPPRGAERRGTGKDRRRSATDVIYERLMAGESFWTAVHEPFMARELSRAQVRDLVRRGLEEARGNYRIVVRLFNMPPGDYKRFLNFLRKHDCQLPFKDFR